MVDLVAKWRLSVKAIRIFERWPAGKTARGLQWGVIVHWPIYSFAVLSNGDLLAKWPGSILAAQESSSTRFARWTGFSVVHHHRAPIPIPYADGSSRKWVWTVDGPGATNEAQRTTSGFIQDGTVRTWTGSGHHRRRI